MAKVAGKQLSWLTLLGLSLATITQVEGCKDDGSEPDTGTPFANSPLAAEVLAAVGPAVILPALSDFDQTLDELQESLADWSAAIPQPEDASAAKSLAQDQWRQAMAAWQRLEVMQIGPAGSSLDTIAGADIRDEIYSWPTVNPCRVDQKTATGQWQDADFFEANLVIAYGLDALEHLLFAGDESVCNPAVPPLSDGSWAAMGQEGVSTARAGFASTLVAEITQRTEDLIETWSSTGDDFSGQLARTTAESVYASNQEALNAVYDALFYLETKTKDRKLAQPIGLRDCEEESCPSDLEGLVSGETLPMLTANLEGFEALFMGGAGVGLDDLVTNLGHGDLVESILIHLDEAKTAILEFDGELVDSIESGDGQANHLFDTVGALTSEIKWDLATVLSMTVPTEAAGDND